MSEIIQQQIQLPTKLMLMKQAIHNRVGIDFPFYKINQNYTEKPDAPWEQVRFVWFTLRQGLNFFLKQDAQKIPCKMKKLLSL